MNREPPHPSALPAAVIAEFFLDQAAQAGEFLSPMKLQKLVYIAHGWHLAVTGRPLIRETISAWQFGPVIAELYHEFKKFGGNPIVDWDLEHNNAEGSLQGYKQAKDALQTPEYKETLEILNSVWNRYCRFTAIELSVMTHRKNTPWSNAYRTSENPRGGEPISNESIQHHFLELSHDNTQH